jgi:hypothetical protein
MTRKMCVQCNENFVIGDDEQEFLKQMAFKVGEQLIDVPLPTHCPICRLQRRLSFRNQIYVSRVRSLNGEMLFSQFIGTPQFPVITNKAWWDEDGWSPEQYGQEYDFNRTFFEQWHELSKKVPRPAINGVQSENSDYCNNAGDLKNCYFVFDAGNIEDSLYCEGAADSRCCVDCTVIVNCELCYDCVACTRCYDLQSSLQCTDCSESFFLKECKSCKHCFGCVNLRRREYCIFNKQVTKEEYDRFISSLSLSSYRERQRIHAQVQRFWNSAPQPHLSGSMIERCTGNHILNAKDVDESFFVQKSEGLRYCMNISYDAKNCQDYFCWGEGAELLYECGVTGGSVFHLAFCWDCWYGARDLLYCLSCHGSANCFGCISARKKEYMILNKQYSQHEYEELLPRIIEHMTKTGEWGEAFPMHLSPVPYNLSLAQRYFPLSEGDCKIKGLRYELLSDSSVANALEGLQLTDGLPQSDETLTVCSTESKRHFRITKQELQWYRKFNVPLPRTTYFERMEARAKLLGPVRLLERRCEKSGILIKTVHKDGVVWDREIFEKEIVS